MSLTVANCIKAMRHEISTTGAISTFSPEIDGMDLVNQAGAWLFSPLHGWKFQERPAIEVSTVAGQNYVDLPADMQSIVSVHRTEGILLSVHLTTLDEIDELETSTTGASWHYWAAVMHIAGTDGVPVPKLRLWPVPGSSVTNELRIRYRAGWTKLAKDSDIVPVPPYCEGLFKLACRAFASGIEDNDGREETGARLSQLEVGPVYRAARAQDQLIQPEYGQIRNGITENYRSGIWRGHWCSTPIGGPS